KEFQTSLETNCDDNENDVTSEISELFARIFPCELRFMDLTQLDLRYKPRVPTLMLIRSEWNSMMEIVEESYKGVSGSAVVTGQPGIGRGHFFISFFVV